MARWNPFRRTPAPEQPDTAKAVSPATAPAATFSPQQVAALINASSAAGRQIPGVANPLPRTDPMVAFGPGMPLFPAAIDPARPDTGRPEPRFNEYPVSSNLPGVTDRLVPWKVLRDAADIGGLIRRCIEIRKAEVAGLEWAITFTKAAVEQAAFESSQARSEVEQAMRQRLAGEIARCTAFWQKPDPGQGEDFSDWVGKVLEDHLVLDAVAIYPRLTYGGGLYALEVIDGATVKPLRDHRGGRPTPPNPAYQQLLWGFPRGEFVADTDADGNIINGYGADRLIYKRRNVRSHTPYGYSAVEQALEDVDVWLRRRKWIRDEYSEGTLPTGYVRNNGAAGWTPEQVLQYETALNDAYNGSTAARHRLRVFPPGFELENMQDFGEKYKPEYDLFLIKLIASHLDVTIAELGFTEQGGLGSTGWHEGQANVQARKGTLPTLRWLQQLITSISRTHLGMPPELQFTFLGVEEEDQAEADKVADDRVKSGRMTYNEERDRLGMPRFDFPEADMPLVHGQGGIVFLDGASKLAAPGQMVQPVEPAIRHDKDSDSRVDPREAVDEDVDSGGDEDGDRQEAVKAELAAFRRWARRNPNPKRPFEFEVVTKADAPDLDGEHVAFAGDAAPKGDRPVWPGWGRDEATAAVWAPRIRRALSEAVDCRVLAERWLARELVKADEPSLAAVQQPPQPAGGSEWAVALAAAFLAAQGIDLAGPLGPLLASTRMEGYVIGAVSARAVLTRQRKAVFGWRVGEAQAAERKLTSVEQERATVWRDRDTGAAQGLAGSRTRALARILARAKAAGQTVAQLARALREALADEAWARRVVMDAVTQSAAQAARDAYADAGPEVTGLLWCTEPGACERCRDNEKQGPVPIGGTWPDGSIAPPAHPNCRCALMPA